MAFKLHPRTHLLPDVWENTRLYSAAVLWNGLPLNLKLLSSSNYHFKSSIKKNWLLNLFKKIFEVVGILYYLLNPLFHSFYCVLICFICLYLFMPPLLLSSMFLQYVLSLIFHLKDHNGNNVGFFL